MNILEIKREPFEDADPAAANAAEPEAARIAALEQQISDLQAQLDKELEWRPSERSGTRLRQRDYEELMADCTGTDGEPCALSEDEARSLVADEFGFNFERVEIVHTVHTFEINKHRQLREAHSYTRPPLYASSDWNYVRFNVQGSGSVWSYEMIDGELIPYLC